VPLQTSPNRDQLWVNGNVSKLANGSIHFEPTMAGRLDWGREAYAAGGKLVPSSSQASRKSGTDVDRFISFVWLTGNDFGQSDFPGMCDHSGSADFLTRLTYLSESAGLG